MLSGQVGPTYPCLAPHETHRLGGSHRHQLTEEIWSLCVPWALKTWKVDMDGSGVFFGVWLAVNEVYIVIRPFFFFGFHPFNIPRFDLERLQWKRAPLIHEGILWRGNAAGWLSTAGGEEELWIHGGHGNDTQPRQILLRLQTGLSKLVRHTVRGIHVARLGEVGWGWLPSTQTWA